MPPVSINLPYDDQSCVYWLRYIISFSNVLGHLIKLYWVICFTSDCNRLVFVYSMRDVHRSWHHYNQLQYLYY